MLGTGGTALVAKIIGENDREKANETFTRRKNQNSDLLLR